jgi:N-acetylglucosamine-6-phosphate deacetylase
VAARLVVRSSEILAQEGVVDGHLVVEGPRIEAIASGDPPARAGEVLDVRPHRVLPGLIDVHIHGAGGWSVEAGTPDQVIGLARFLPSRGVTAFQATAWALPPDELETVATAVRDAMAEPGGGGARILGLHSEGPYLSPDKRGAMNPEFFRDPSREEIERLEAIAPGVLRHLTLAPERPGAVELVRWMTGRGGVVVSAGHTDATFEQARAGIDAGVRLANHTYNAMRGLHQREPGAFGALALDGRVTCELIADGRHVHPAAMQVLIRVAGADRVCLISDAVFPAGLPPATYDLFGRPARVTEEGFCVFSDGTLAGSAQLLPSGVRNLVELVMVPLRDAVPMASLNPARVAGVDRAKGSLAAGKDADFVVLSENWEPVWTVIEGEVVHGPGRPAGLENPAVRPLD